VGIAVPIVPGPASAALDDLERGILDVYGLLARPREFAGYHGTETVPPFLDPMMWLVALTPATAGIAQIDRIVTATADGQRPLPPRALQPSRGRPVVRLRAKVLILRTGSSGAETGELART
jgi:carbonic anhydrase